MPSPFEETLLEAIRSLPAGKQQEILAYANRLREKPSRRPRKAVKGLWADFGVSLSAEEIDELRSEMWKHFPRDPA